MGDHMATKTGKAKARIINGQLVPDPATIRAIMRDLRARAGKERSVAKAWRRNPRAVLGALGLGKLIQNELLAEEGMSVRWSPTEKALASGCNGCSGCCCSGCSYSG